MACNRLTLARAEPVYEDFKKVAETFVCTACGHRYPSRDKTPFVDADGRPRVFSDADKPVAVKVFKADARRRSCAWCRHYIVNPFYQRCGLNNREAEATDVCARFTPKPDQPAEAGASKVADANSRFDALFKKEESDALAASAAKETVKETPVIAPPARASAAPQPKTPPAAPVASTPPKAPAKKQAAATADKAAKETPIKKPAKKPVAKPRKPSAE